MARTSPEFTLGLKAAAHVSANLSEQELNDARMRFQRGLGHVKTQFSVQARTGNSPADCVGTRSRAEVHRRPAADPRVHRPRLDGAFSLADRMQDCRRPKDRK